MTCPSPGWAALIMRVDDLVAPPGSTGSFDVALVNTDPTTAYRVASHSIQLALTGVAGVQFTAATIATTSSPYIYVRSGTTVPPASPLSFDSFPTTSFLASDSEFDPLGYRLVNPGTTFGLARVSYSVASTALAGVGAISFLDLLGGTSLADEGGNALTFTVRGGTFTVSPTAAVPEPGSIGLLLLGLAGMTRVASWRRAREARRPR